MKKNRIFHFHNGGGGGVLSVISNLLKFSTDTDIENHLIYVINKDKVFNYNLPGLTGAKSERIFYYSAKWNFYHTCKQLAKLIPDKEAILVAHDWLELGMVSNLGLQNPVVQIVHGNYEYYHQLAKKHQQSIDKYITVSSKIYEVLSKKLPERVKDIHYCKFPVPNVLQKNKQSTDDTINIFYCVKNLYDENKQFLILPKIDSRLQQKGIKAQWNIVGSGNTNTPEKYNWSDNAFVSMYGNVSNDEVLKLLLQQDFFILPSINEGFPVSIVEAMKAGVIPLITNWGGATDELVIDKETGFLFDVGDIEGYANTIESIHKNRKRLNEMSIKASVLANQLFDPYKNTEVYENVFTGSKHIKLKKAFKSYGSRLDNRWIPNFITNFIRSL